ncbi:MAG: methyltransferase, partial [Candidatus Staskawiczbacteria bacterium]|nr:methyltransferase [Candidatus Staskawiczbacteria bacterium]
MIQRIQTKIRRELFKTLTKILKNNYKVISTKSLIKSPNALNSKQGEFTDYIRITTLQLCAYEINEKNINGDVAELGVYKGEFAKKINKEFSNRRLFLFDTFEGFDKLTEHEDICKYGARGHDFSDTTQEQVIKKMPFPKKCVIKAGLFERTCKEIENDFFCFVSIDVDLFKPTYEGLKFFYPRLHTGGYIFVHDYNNKDWPGVKEAVNTFCKEQEISFVPIPDTHG